ncbi:CDK-activating kinase assembly factor MAT1 [Halyomorpha halys]|uniref:CDK-activating kinase assembly factor MAT1 n=1 Tax=Halyomorpha halys TaxID=286706 RepID=UPI0006D4E742|nr:CDK-activating kinase assembly factor MAT1 [Halyomorpha halys]
MEDQVCPRCRTTKYRNPSLKLMVNVCGHSLCENCVDLLFLKGSGSCPECHVPLRRSNFRVQLFEDPNVEKEVDIRKRVLRDFNKKEDDFATLEEYNDYLEQVEEIIHNLVNGIDTFETNRRIEQYKKENRESIMKNKVKIGRSELELEELIEEEKQKEQMRRIGVLREETEVKKRKIRAKEALIDELMFSHGNAKEIVKTFQTMEEEEEEKIVEKATHFSTGIKFGKSGEYLMHHSQEEAPLFNYVAPIFETEGPRAPSVEEVLSGPYLEHVRAPGHDERAGGFESTISCLRALQEAVVGLYFKSS